uniref:Uncharacterized protein n=1 Tax=Vespula pensylvanica TaxID=30213 RepID=A0A834P2V7_VESPE|nr:hypothetical protein H0235_008233 [Vespula pensylvanica]
MASRGKPCYVIPRLFPEPLEFMKNSWKPSGAILGIMLPLLSISYYCQGGHPTSLVLSELAFQGCFPEGWGFRLRPTEMLTAASCLQDDDDDDDDDDVSTYIDASPFVSCHVISNSDQLGQMRDVNR